jgi:hypothetical protein
MTVFIVICVRGLRVSLRNPAPPSPFYEKTESPGRDLFARTIQAGHPLSFYTMHSE